MRIREIEIHDWGCIRQLLLRDLPDGIAILSGPNQTGKSTLVQAVRSTLLDHDHDSRDKIIRSYLPLFSQASPRVRIAWESKSGRYQITKVFSTRKDGLTTLDAALEPGGQALAEAKRPGDLRERRAVPLEPGLLGGRRGGVDQPAQERPDGGGVTPPGRCRD